MREFTFIVGTWKYSHGGEHFPLFLKQNVFNMYVGWLVDKSILTWEFVLHKC